MQLRTRRSDRSSYEVKATGAFAAGEQLSDFIDVRDYPGGCIVWLLPTDLGSVTSVSLVAYPSDDGSTIAVASGDPSKVLSDSSISAGAFPGDEPYKLDLSTADNTLVVNKRCGPYRLPQYAGGFKIGVTGNHASGAYTLRAQRLA